ncbi:lipopolysaccharide biosynthesis protein [Vibrio tasmaniensis]|uniref:lipopolysaccharide biosynthesis protein n=1 Tax=Vibrio tasmaniensis TaxID=212663 RepID=UPI00111B8F34|nr:polysaccharide biosynthesis C-terminal domain-containing protein [Vibrio tasmaniensis]
MKFKSIFAVRILGLLFSFLLNIYVARTYPGSTVGQYFYLVQIVTLVSIIARFGSDTSLLKLAHTFNYKIKNDVLFFSSKIFVYIVSLHLFVYFFSLRILDFDFFNGSGFTVSQFLYIIIPFSITCYCSEYLRGVNEHNKANFCQLILPPALLIILISSTSSSLIYSYTVSVTMASLVSAFFYFKTTPSKPSLNNNIYSRYKQSLPTFFYISVLNVGLSSIDIIALEAYSSSESVAIYGVAIRLSGLAAMLLIIVNGIIGPTFSKLYEQKKINELVKNYQKISLCLMIAALLMLMLSIFFGEWFITIIYGESYRNSYSIFCILVLAQAFALATGPTAYLLMMTGYENYHRNILIVSFFINLILNLSLIPMYELYGAAVATTFSIIIKNGLGLFVANKKFGIFKVKRV